MEYTRLLETTPVMDRSLRIMINLERDEHFLAKVKSLKKGQTLNGFSPEKVCRIYTKQDDQLPSEEESNEYSLHSLFLC